MDKKYQEKPLRELTFAIVGLGLIGGSYAKALRNLKVRKILGMDISHGIARACLNANMIDEVVEPDGSNLKEADVIICSVYPEAIVDFVRNNVQNFRSGMLMTDATGVKGTMPLEIQGLLPAGCEFISGHPMAGRQGSGLGMSDAEIFKDSNYIIVPTEKNTPEAIAWPPPPKAVQNALELKRLPERTEILRSVSEESSRIVMPQSTPSTAPGIAAMSSMSSSVQPGCAAMK